MGQMAIIDHTAAPAHQRSKGDASVSLNLVDGVVRLGRLRQSGSARAILPHIHRAVPEVVFLNTSGGLTGGDQLSYALDLGPGTHATATTQTAERAYAASAGEARVGARFQVASGGHLDWLPQETILFQGASLSRETLVDLAPDASCLLLEAVVLGRHAMGETVARLAFRDRRVIRQAGRLIHLEPTALADATLRDRPALMGPARAFASIVGVGRGVTDRIVALRAVLDEPGVTGGASTIGARLCLRLMARDGLALRRQIVRALMVLRLDAPLPRVWQN